MSVPNECEVIANELIRAIETTMNPYADSKSRMEAYVLCENFKEQSPYCLQLGVSLSKLPNPPLIRHFGIQLLEYAIKYKWNDLKLEDKVFLKEAAWHLVCGGTEGLMVEVAHIKDGVARLVVEMAKREWPQQWPDFLGELLAVATYPTPDTRVELALLTLLRLAEDVAVLQNLENNHRRRDLYQALTYNMGTLFDLFVHLLDSHTTGYTNATDEALAICHCRLANTVLVTLTAFVDWVSIQHIMAKDGRLLEMLCILLGNEKLRTAAAEPLLQILSRKGPGKERTPLLIMFSEGAMNAMLSAALAVSNQPLNDLNYTFLKRLSEVLVALGSQLCSLYGKEHVSKPPNFPLYLQALLALTWHPSLTVNRIAVGLWFSLFRHPLISEDPDLLIVLEAWISIVAKKVVKVGSTFKQDDVESAYSRLDFDCDEDFAAFFNKFRMELIETIRCATVIAPNTMFQCCQAWFLAQLSQPQEMDASSNPHSKLAAQWDALALFMDCVFSRIYALKEGRPGVVLEDGLRLIDCALAYNSTDPLVMSALLSCISAMLVFVQRSPDRLTPVLNKIFSALVFTVPGQKKESRSRIVQNVRRHACSLMVKIGLQYPALLLPVFGELKQTVDNLCLEPGQLSRMEKVTLQEALLLVSNQFCDFKQQGAFIQEVVGSFVETWSMPSFSQALDSTASFMAFVGLDKPPVEPSSDDINGQNRSELIMGTNVFIAVIKRCKCPQDPDAAARGGFVLTGSVNENGGHVLRHPVAPYLMPLLLHFMKLTRVLHGLWHTEAKEKLSLGYVKAYDMLENEKQNILGSASSFVAPGGDSHSTFFSCVAKVQSPLERMQQFLAQLHYNACHLLGALGESIGREFYSVPSLAALLSGSVMQSLDLVPDYRLRSVLRVFLRPFIEHCPLAQVQDVALSVLGQFCPFMLNYLGQKWLNVTQQCALLDPEDDNRDVQEVLEDMLIRQVTKEYLDVLKSVLFIGGSLATGVVMPSSMDAVDAERDGSEEMQQTVECHESMSELGKMALATNGLSQVLIACILRALTWPDTIVNSRSCLLCGPVLRHLAQLKPTEGPLSPEIASYFLTSVLTGLQVLGQHEGNFCALIHLGMQVYDLLRPRFPGLVEVMLQIPGCNKGELEKLDEKVLSNADKPSKHEKATKADKLRKELFRKICGPIVGQSVGQLFKKPIELRDLPRFEPIIRRHKPSPVVDSNSDVGLTALFGTPDLTNVR